MPLLLEDEDGTAHGTDWARGFMRGMGMRHDRVIATLIASGVRIYRNYLASASNA